MTSAAPVAVGMPIFNGRATIRRALNSLLGQTHRDIDIIISDNASDDGTSEILRTYAAHDDRIRLTRQPRNIGPHANFRFVLMQAQSPYFMWAAADDFWAPQFIERNLRFLETHPDYVTSVSRIELAPPLSNGKSDDNLTCTLDGAPKANMKRFLFSSKANLRFYGLHRRVALVSAWSDEIYWGADLLLTIRLLRQGKQHQIDDVLFTYNTRGMGSLAYDGVRSLKLGFVDTWMPYLRFSRQILGMPELRWSPRIWGMLAFRNTHLIAHMIAHHLLRAMGLRRTR